MVDRGGWAWRLVAWFVRPILHHEAMCERLVLDYLRVVGPHTGLHLARLGFGRRGTIHVRLARLRDRRLLWGFTTDYGQFMYHWNPRPPHPTPPDLPRGLKRDATR